MRTISVIRVLGINFRKVRFYPFSGVSLIGL